MAWVMRYMVIETFGERGARPVFERFRERGRLLPPGLQYVESWVAADLRQCYQLMECEDPALLDRWIARWSDLVQFDVIPVLSSQEASAAVFHGD